MSEMVEPTDKERLDWLEQIVSEGVCPGLINDDNGHWALVFDGMQNVPTGDAPEDISTSFFIEAHQWRDTVREAIDAALEESEE